MSYCRFSTDDFQTDIYCYKSDNGYVIHVAKNKRVFTEKLPPKVDLKNITDYLERWNTVLKMVDKAERVPIGLEFDGETYINRTPQELLQTLLMLKEAGYRFPNYVIDIVREEEILDIT